MNTKTCPQCKVNVLPKSDNTCPGCGAHLTDVPTEPVATEENDLVDASPSKTSSTVTIERIKWKHRSFSWTVFLNGKPVGQLPEQGRMAIPISIGRSTVSIAVRVMGDYQQLISIPVIGPDDFDMLFRVAEEYGPFKREFYVAEKRRLKSEERCVVTTTQERAKVQHSRHAHEIPTLMADVSGSYQPPQGFKFTEVFWQKTAILFGFYWLFRWLCPSVLPRSLRELDLRTTLIPCAILGLIWTGIAFLMRLGAKTEQKSTTSGGPND